MGPPLLLCSCDHFNHIVLYTLIFVKNLHILQRRSHLVHVKHCSVTHTRQSVVQTGKIHVIFGPVRVFYVRVLVWWEQREKLKVSTRQNFKTSKCLCIALNLTVKCRQRWAMGAMKVVRNTHQQHQYTDWEMKWVNVQQCIRFESWKTAPHLFILCKWIYVHLCGRKRFIKTDWIWMCIVAIYMQHHYS